MKPDIVYTNASIHEMIYVNGAAYNVTLDTSYHQVMKIYGGAGTRTATTPWNVVYDNEITDNSVKENKPPAKKELRKIRCSED